MMAGYYSGIGVNGRRDPIWRGIYDSEARLLNNLKAQHPGVALVDAATSLRAHYRLRDRAFVGVNDVEGAIHVYFYKKVSLRDLPATWEGWAIEWTSGVGRPRAATKMAPVETEATLGRKTVPPDFHSGSKLP